MPWRTRLTLLGVVVLALVACSKRTEPASMAPDVNLRTLDGSVIALAETTGPILVNFWSTSCSICLEEMPALSQLHRDFEPSGFSVVAVAMASDRPDQVLEYAEAQELSFPVAIDIDGAALDAFDDVKGTPTSFLYADDGRLVHKLVGRVDMAALRREIASLVQPQVIQPEVIQPGVIQPGAIRPEAVQPEADLPGAVQPDAGKS